MRIFIITVVFFIIPIMVKAQISAKYFFEEAVKELNSNNQIGDFKLFYVEQLIYDSGIVYNISYVMNQSEIDNLKIIGIITLNRRVLLAVNQMVNYPLDSLDEKLLLKEKSLLFKDNPPWDVILYRRNNALIISRDNQTHIKYLSELRNSSEYYRYFPPNFSYDSIAIKDFDINQIVDKILKSKSNKDYKK